MPGTKVADIGCNPKHVYSEVSPVVFSGAYSQESVVRIVALMSHKLMGR